MGKKADKKTNAMRLLEQGGVAYQVRTYLCDGVNFDGNLVAEQVGLPPEQVFKTLVTRESAQRIVVCCIPVNRKLDLKNLAAAAGSKRLEMVAPNELAGLTGYIRGGVSPVGMKKQYPVYIDQSASEWEQIAISAGMRGMQLLVNPQLLQAFAHATFGNFGPAQTEE